MCILSIFFNWTANLSTCQQSPIEPSDMDPEALFEPLGRCRNVDEFEKLNRIGEGTYGTVYRARDRRSQRVVALKRVLLHNESSEGVRRFCSCCSCSYCGCELAGAPD